MSRSHQRTIRELLARDLRKRIEEVIQVDQIDEGSVYTEITEYVATERIKEQYLDLLRDIAEAPADPHEGIGVWISGFFGSGKSSFAKNLGYVLANREVCGQRASDLFKQQIDNRRIGELIDFINVKLPTEVIMFDISKSTEVRRGDEKIAEIVYRSLLSHLGYATDYNIAELEIQLEKEGRLEEFIALCPRVNTGLDWKRARSGALKINYASAILHQLDSEVFPQADSWAKGLKSDKHTTITVQDVVARTFELTARRRPGRATVFIIDEVGQYVARSAEKIEDLRALVEEFGKASKNRLKARQTIAPVWFVVTSQEKLDEIVDAIGSRRVELAKLQDRFRHRIDLAPADISEVTTRRVLGKKNDAVPLLRRIYQESQGQLNAACRLERTERRSEVSEEDFINFYPYLPHYIEMSIDIMSGIRLQPGAPRHLGGSNRTIIKQVYEMLVSERTAMADAAVGQLVTLDRIFELVEGNLSSEKQKDISDIALSTSDPMPARVAKTICLLEFVRNIPRTEANIAACLVDRVGEPAPIASVQQALQWLEAAQFVRSTEEGWKLQTAQEKNWDTEKRSIEPRPKDRNEITREMLGEIFSEPQLKNYRYKNLKTFPIGINVDGVRVGAEGDVQLSIFVAESEDALARKLEEVRGESRLPSNKDQVCWVFAFSPEIDELVARLYASRQMIAKYEQLRAQNKITNQEADSLANEKHEAERLKRRLRDKMHDALERGHGIFRGVEKDASALGAASGEIFRHLCDWVFPDLYPKLEMGARQVTGREVEELLKAANLSALSPIFYDGEKGLSLVVKEGTKWVPQTSAPIAKEILDYIRREHSYGNKVTGKNLIEHFGGLGYGWDQEIIRLVLAVLLRAGSIEVTCQGRRHRDYKDPQSRVPFQTIPAFRAASFAPRESIDLKTLTTAVSHLEALTGEEVEIEESALAVALKKFADEELEIVVPLGARAQANGLPVTTLLEEYQQMLSGILAAASDDCVRILAGEGQSLREQHDCVRRMREALSDEGLQTIRNARLAAGRMWSALAARESQAALQERAEALKNWLDSVDFFTQLNNIRERSEEIGKAYRILYERVHGERTGAYQHAVDEIKGRAEWLAISDEIQESLLWPLSIRACDPVDLPEGATECSKCQASLGEMEADIAAVAARKEQVITRLGELTRPVGEEESPVARLKLAEFFTGDLDSEEAINEAVGRLREALLALLAQGSKFIVE